MIVLNLDISSKTGYCVSESAKGHYKILERGVLSKKEKPSIQYPGDYLAWSKDIASDIISLIDRVSPHTICVEETAKGSKDAHSQKILEWVHKEVAAHLFTLMRSRETNVLYLMTGEWRQMVGCIMTKEEKKKNQAVSKQRKKGIKVAKDDTGKRIGKTTKKHVNIRRVKELFDIDLKVKDNDIADAILLNYAAHLRITGE